jgi:CheY-like chemotaxis protein
MSDRHQAELALLNHVINARDAMPSGGRITIKTEPYRADVAAPDLNPGDYMRLSVIDNGTGMAPEVVQKAFDPFFTTKPVGQGTGLGLSQVYGFGRQSGGTAQIDSVLGKGTSVSLLIPAAPNDAQATAKTQAQAPIAALPSAKVLVVDDDDAVRRIAVYAVDALGLEVVQAASGVEALEAAARDQPDLVLLDFAMPDMNGAQVARALRARSPQLKIIFVTGYAELEQLQELIGPGEQTLRKPYRLSDLQAALAQALVPESMADQAPGRANDDPLS